MFLWDCALYAAFQTHSRNHLRFLSNPYIAGAKRKKDDTFGANDDDWNVYKTIVSIGILSLYIYTLSKSTSA